MARDKDHRRGHDKDDRRAPDEDTGRDEEAARHGATARDEEAGRHEATARDEETERAEAEAEAQAVAELAAEQEEPPEDAVTRAEREDREAAAGEPAPPCVFCRIIDGELPAYRVYEDGAALAFLDRRPLFPGHTLVVTRAHVETLTDLAETSVGAYFTAVRRVVGAVERGMEAAGSFVAENNRVSQSVPHLHVHVVPRNFKDGLRGFFWPRTEYEDETAARRIAARIRAEF